MVGKYGGKALLLLSASVKRFSVSCMQDLANFNWASYLFKHEQGDS